MTFWRSFTAPTVIAAAIHLVLLFTWEARLPDNVGNLVFVTIFALLTNAVGILFFCVMPAYLAKRIAISPFIQLLLLTTFSIIGGCLIFSQIGVRDGIVPAGALFGAIASATWIVLNLRFLDVHQKAENA